MWCGGAPGGATGGELALCDLNAQFMRVNINGDGVTLLHEGNRSTECRLWRDVGDHESMRCAREAAVSNECDLVAEPLTHECCGHGEHFAHPWATNRAFVADHHDVARKDRVRANCSEGRLLRIEDARWSTVMSTLVSGELHDCTLGCQAAA